MWKHYYIVFTSSLLFIHIHVFFFLFTHIYVKTLTPLLDEDVAIEVHVSNGFWDMKMSRFKSKDI
jgi:hypothetical protein